MLCWEHAISDIKIPFYLTFCHTTTGFLFPKENRLGEDKEKNLLKCISEFLLSTPFFIQIHSYLPTINKSKPKKDELLPMYFCFCDAV